MWCRQDTWSDLQLFAVVNLAVIFLFGWLKTHLVDAADSISPEELENKPFWLSIYQVIHHLLQSDRHALFHTVTIPHFMGCYHGSVDTLRMLLSADSAVWGPHGQILQVIFGQQLPDEATSFAQQSFAVSVAAIGLAAFALVLALVEQVVLQVVDENVARGSRVFETGHVSPLHAPLSLLDRPRALASSCRQFSSSCSDAAILVATSWWHTRVLTLAAEVIAHVHCLNDGVMGAQILVLGFCDSQRDLEVVQKILSQVPCNLPLLRSVHAISRGPYMLKQAQMLTVCTGATRPKPAQSLHVSCMIPCRCRFVRHTQRTVAASL